MQNILHDKCRKPPCIPLHLTPLIPMIRENDGPSHTKFDKSI
ncbi:hypothetical protein [Ehrlichia ruminantium]|nr:hypothetical protein [Ehrlichia ruminantium]